MPWIFLLEKIDIKRLKRDANPRPLYMFKDLYIFLFVICLIIKQIVYFSPLLIDKTQPT